VGFPSEDGIEKNPFAACVFCSDVSCWPEPWISEDCVCPAVEARWTFLALLRVDADIAERLFEQRSRFNRACVTGTADDIEQEGAALCRGYAAAVAALQAARVEDDPYLVGRCSLTGTTVAIGAHRAAVTRVREPIIGRVLHDIIS
jgi:hypothetical protein